MGILLTLGIVAAGTGAFCLPLALTALTARYVAVAAAITLIVIGMAVAVTVWVLAGSF